MYQLPNVCIPFLSSVHPHKHTPGLVETSWSGSPHILAPRGLCYRLSLCPHRNQPMNCSDPHRPFSKVTLRFQVILSTSYFSFEVSCAPFCGRLFLRDLIRVASALFHDKNFILFISIPFFSELFEVFLYEIFEVFLYELH